MPKNLGWDETLSDSRVNEWQNIVRHFNVARVKDINPSKINHFQFFHRPYKETFLFPDYASATRDNADVSIPIPSELIIAGKEILFYNVNSNLQELSDPDAERLSNIAEHCFNNELYKRLLNVHCKLIGAYSQVFHRNVIDQAVDSKSSNFPLKHKAIHNINKLCNITCASVFKGGTREVIERHTSCLIPLLQNNPHNNFHSENAQIPDSEILQQKNECNIYPLQQEVIHCFNKIQDLISSNFLCSNFNLNIQSKIGIPPSQ